MHHLTPLGAKKLKDVVKPSDYYVIGPSDLAEEVVKSCKACAITNAGHSIYTPGKRLRGDRPEAYCKVDFTKIKPARYGNKYISVFFIDIFSGWAEAFPTRTEIANMVAKKITEEIFLSFGIPKVIGSDNGPAFVAQVSQGLATQLGINWKLHCAYQPQSQVR